ncbi:hypothetical protein KCP77_04650 [Salmonella enterica subsp. enterica]|nr:hypothetical protein KCP77_04650 [Salmonella enterica subsp. enterica]
MPKINLSPSRNSAVPMKTPASYNFAVRRAAAVVNVYNRSMNSTAHINWGSRTLGPA